MTNKFCKCIFVKKTFSTDFCIYIQQDAFKYLMPFRKQVLLTFNAPTFLGVFATNKGYYTIKKYWHLLAERVEPLQRHGLSGSIQLPSTEYL